MAYYKSGGINVTSNSNVSINTASGSIASFNTNLSMPVLETKAIINPVQNGTPWIDSNVVNKEPYIKRNVVGTATRIGNHLYDKLVGGTVAWNQIRTNGDFTVATGWNSTNSTRSVSNNVMTLTVSSTASEMELYDSSTNRMELVENHKYFTSYKVKSTVDITKMHHRGFIVKNSIPGFAANTENTIEIIGNASTNKMQDLYFYGEFNLGDTVNIKEIVCFDLTQMFGSTIADYIYSLERTTAGAGVAWFKTLFPNDYYAYNAGELMSVKATAHIMKNASNQVIGNYALDSNLVLNGLFKLDANNKLYADGDIYESSGAVTRKYKQYTIDSNTTIKSQTDLSNVTRYIFITDNEEEVVSLGGVICDRLVKDNSYSGDYPHIYIDNTGNKGRVYVFLPIGQAIGTINLIYELATPTTEQAASFTNPQVCDENGTEEYTDSRAVAIPVGHETYQANICPISGFDGCNITRCGANLWNEQWEVGGINNTTGETYNTNDRIRSKNFCACKPNTNYYEKSDDVHTYIYWYDATKTFISRTNIVPNAVVTSPNGAMFFKIVDSDRTTYNNSIGINYPSTQTSYVAHDPNSTTYPVTWQDEAGTVYGGNLDLTTGVLTVTYSQIANLANYSWTLISNERWATNALKSLAKLPPDNNTKANLVCSTFEVRSISSFVSTGNGIGLSYDGALRVRNGSTVDKPVGYLVYELATPVTYQLTPIQINALLGVNNVWHDCNGDTEVKYRKVNTQ